MWLRNSKLGRLSLLSSEALDAAIHRNTVHFEYYRATFSKPGDRLPSSRKPSTSIFHILNQVTIAGVPQSLRGKAAIVPVNRYATAKSTALSTIR